jgi:ribosomal protein S18 acetylase RimI-like enzyme
MISILNETFELMNPANINKFDCIYDIYLKTIPKSERKSYSKIKEMLTNQSYRIFYVQIENKVVGFSILFVFNNCFGLLEYMAIDPSTQGLGIGSRLFNFTTEQLLKENPKLIILLEVESDKYLSDDLEIRQKRLSFYRRLGCLQIDNLTYILPLKTKEQPPEMYILVFTKLIRREISKSELHNCLKIIYKNVYGCSEDDFRITHMLRNADDFLNLI